MAKGCKEQWSACLYFEFYRFYADLVTYYLLCVILLGYIDIETKAI